MLASYIAKHHWLADLLDAWIVERGGGRRRGLYFQVRDPSLLALSPYLVPFGYRGCGVLSSRLCVLAFLQFEWTRPWSLLCKLIWIEWSTIKEIMVPSFFILQTYLSHDFRFFLLQCERNMVLSFLKSICKNPHGVVHFHGSFRRGYSYQPTTPAL